MQMGFGLMEPINPNPICIFISLNFPNAEGSIFLKLDKDIKYCDTCIRIPNKLS